MNDKDMGKLVKLALVASIVWYGLLATALVLGIIWLAKVAL